MNEFEKLAMQLVKDEQSSQPEEAATEQTQNENTEPVNTDEVSLEDTEELENEEVESTEEVETPTAEEEDSTTDQGIDIDDVLDLDDLDGEDSTSVEATPEPTFDFTELGNAIGDETIKSKEDVVNKVKALQEQLVQLEKQKESQLEGIPENLQKAIELAKSGGDYLEYLGISTVDYSQVDPVELYEYEVTQAFTDANGNVDEDKVVEYLDNLSDVDKELRGRQLQKQFIADQKNRADQLAAQAAQKKVESDARLQATLDTIDNVAGFKLKASHKKTIYDDITSGKLFKELFYDKNGQYDFKKVVENSFKAKNFDKIQNFYKQQVRSATKKEIINDLSNSTVNRPPQQTVVTPKKVDPMTAWIESLKPKGN